MENDETDQASPEALLRYLRDCYQENGSRGGIWNLFGNKVHARLFIEDSDDLLGKNHNHLIRGEKAGALEKQVELYEKERDFLYVTGFIVGKVERLDAKEEIICAPLVTCPAEFIESEEKNVALLNLDSQRIAINSAVISFLGGDDFSDEVERSIADINSIEESINTIRRSFENKFPNCRTDSLLKFPLLEKESVLRSAITNSRAEPPNQLHLISCAAVALFNKSREMRGVLNELEGMQDIRLSAPVSTLLGNDNDIDIKPDKPGRIPAHLSASQKKIVDSSRKHSLTVAIGPPGTGKSFTIAALAIDAISRGKSVIIASRMNHAVDVAGDKIESAIGLKDAIVRGGRKGYLKDLKSFVDNLLTGMYSNDPETLWGLHDKEDALDDLDRDIKKLAREISRREYHETKIGRLLAKEQPNFFDRWWISRLSDSVAERAQINELARELYVLNERYLALTLEYLEACRSYYIADELEMRRDGFQSFSKAIRSRTGSKAERHFDDILWQGIFRALPVWLVNFSDVHKILPLLSEEFDLAIVDEASQCDIASALPVLQRAKRAVIAGDPKQLRHLSFLSEARLSNLAEFHGLDESQRERYHFRSKSLLDLVCDSIPNQNQVGFLDEHFRSRPEIINFSNHQFYGGNLKIMTGNHLCPHREQTEPPIQIRYIANGRRESAGHNAIEASALLEAVKGYLEKKSLSDEVESIGILSPFRDQVEWFRKQITESEILPHHLWSRHQLLIGTAHTFQGEERDVMFMSLGLDMDSAEASFRFLDKPDLFNVAVTRARNQVILFHSFPAGRLRETSLWSQYLAYGKKVENVYDEPASNDPLNDQDKFACEVADFLRHHGARVTVNYPLAGHAIDLVYTKNNHTRGIDLIGYPGNFNRGFPLERIYTFQRAGLEIYPLAYSEWKFKRELCEAWLEKLLRTH